MSWKTTVSFIRWEEKLYILLLVLITEIMKLKDIYFLEKSYDKHRQHIKKHSFPTKFHVEYMYIHGWFMSMYDKNHYNIVK